MKKILVVSLSLLFMACQNKDEIKHDQYMVEGQQAYELQCANCHQSDGRGLANLYPPIAGSDFLKDKNKVACLMKYGITGEIVVNNKKYNQAMPGNFKLQELDIAIISTYIYNTWGNETTITSIDSVRSYLKKCN